MEGNTATSHYFATSRPVGPHSPRNRKIIYEENPLIPYNGSASIPTIGSNFKVHVAGQVSVSPDQFAIEIKEGENVLFHFNPRWSANRTVLNARIYGRPWGSEEYAYFPSLAPNQPFDITITVEQDKFYVQVNHDNIVQFLARIPTSGTQRTVTIEKIKRNDVHVSLVEVTTNN